MNKSTPALVMYFAASLMYVMSIIFKWDSGVTLLFKPMIFPAIYFYYLQESGFKPSLFPSLILVLFFIGDMVILMEFEHNLVPLMILNMAAYLILAYHVTKDILIIKNPRISNFMILNVCLVIGFLMSLLYIALSLVFNASDPYFGMLLAYGIILMLLSIEIVTYYFLKTNATSFFVLMTIICLGISDLFHVLYNYYDSFSVFININVLCQAASFYFLVKYFLHNNHYNNSLSQYED
ncbi:MAG TPA: hypothetical protein VLB74_04995 [Flavobacterium sp.]|uniref:hypothetical protein n=1 Tax=Flavobacterium sp. TaxID=239 RepID=UPI002BF68528|nr:hypothetical protein [Flavobacterium sp.]HSD13984.1 hypothetical protein [Flavobacterium sp.]